MAAKVSTLVDFYRTQRFNPVPIDLGTPEALAMHTAKRRNLYERHLGIPFGLLRGMRVLEFGCNTGENSIVLAMQGARLTLVEPNEHAHDRLRSLFDAFSLGAMLDEVRTEGIQTFPEDQQYDLVLAEGFLFTLPDKQEMAEKMCRLLRPGGIGVISFSCRFGGLLEMLKRLVLFRACELAEVGFTSPESLELGRRLFGAAFAQLSASRPFDAWWKDLLSCPFYVSEHLWSYQEILPAIWAGGCEVLSTSPLWSAGEHYRWYKSVPGAEERRRAFLEQWGRQLGFILTGHPAAALGQPAGQAVVDGVSALVDSISAYTGKAAAPLASVRFPEPLRAWFLGSEDTRLREVGACLDAVFAALPGGDVDRLVEACGQSGLPSLWGSAYHYLSFVKEIPPFGGECAPWAG